MVFGNIRKIEEVFDLVPRLLFVGHSHVPGIIGPDRSFWHPEDTGVVYELDPEAKYIINVGSVGQPRDGDNRSCYVILEGNKITYYRVPYAFEKTMRKMERVGPISKEAAERLACGR